MSSLSNRCHEGTLPRGAVALSSCFLLLASALFSAAPEGAEDVTGVKRVTQKGQRLVHVDGWTHPVSELRGADLDGDGRTDLILTSKILNHVQPFLQTAEGDFRPLSPLADVGYHPNGVLPLAVGEGRELIVQNAETRSELRFYGLEAFDDEARLNLIKAVRIPRPWKTLPLVAPGRGLSLVTFSKDQLDLTVMPSLEFEPALTHGTPTSMKGSDHPSASAIESPILARVGGDSRDRILFIDSRRSAIRLLDIDENGAPLLSDIASLPDGAAAVLLAAADLNRDGTDDIAVFGLNDDPMSLLLSDPHGGYEQVTLTLGRDYNQTAIFVEEVDSAPVLLLVRDTALIAMRFTGYPTAPERRVLPLDKGIGSLVISVADINGDSIPDLLIGTTGRSALPPTILLGPVWDHLEDLASLLADPSDFGLRESSDGKRAFPTPAPVRKIPSLPAGLPMRLD